MPKIVATCPETKRVIYSSIQMSARRFQRVSGGATLYCAHCHRVHHFDRSELRLDLEARSCDARQLETKT